jgi:hypothetical protein
LGSFPKMRPRMMTNSGAKTTEKNRPTGSREEERRRATTRAR